MNNNNQMNNKQIIESKDEDGKIIDNNKNENNNDDTEETNEEIIENYPYEFYEETIDNKPNDDSDKFNNQNKKYNNNDSRELEQNKMKSEISDLKQHLEANQQILNINNLNLSQINEKNNNEDVIDFDEESIINLHYKKESKLDKNENINKLNKPTNEEIIESKNIKKEDNNKQIIKHNQTESIDKRVLNGNYKDNYSKKKIEIDYSLDQDEVRDILNLNKENNFIENQSSELPKNDMEKLIINRINTKLLLEDLYEKEKKFKNAYAEYYSKLSETMKNNYFKNILESSNISKEYIKQKNDINIFYSNNNNNYINYIDKNEGCFGVNNMKKNKSESNILFNKNNPYEEYKNSKKIQNMLEKNKNTIVYIRHPTIILSIRKFLNEYNNSIQTRAFTDASKNPLLNYEIFINILNDLYYLEKGSSIYIKLWDFLLTIKSNNKIDNKEEMVIESNVLLLFILLLNGYFNNKKIIDELEIELNWLKFENYEMLIVNNEYIENNFSILIEIRKKNYLMKSKIDENNNINQYNYNSEDISKRNENFLYDNINFNTNNENSNPEFNKIGKNINTNKKDLERQINNINKKLYDFKSSNSSFIIKEISNDKNNNKLKTNKSTSFIKIKNNNKSFNKNLINNSYNNNNILKNTLNENKNKSISKNISRNKHIKYNEYNLLSENINNKNDILISIDEKNIHNDILNKRPSNTNISNNIITKGKSGNYITKIKQNKTDLKKLFKNNEYKDGPLNKRLEEIKRKRNISRSIGKKVKINYEEYNTNIDKNKDINAQIENQQYQLRKHTPQKKKIILYNFMINGKEFTLEHNPEENIEIEIMKLIQKNNLKGISSKYILEKIKMIQKDNSGEIK